MGAVYLLRHGETTWNRDRRIQGQRQSRLSAKGRADAAAQGRLLAPILAGRPDLPIYCSTLLRTRQTASIALAGRTRRVRYDDRLIEIGMGLLEGQFYADLPRSEPKLMARYNEVFDLALHAPGGEGQDALVARTRSFLRDLPQDAVVIGHGIALAFLRVLLLDRPLADAPQGGRAQGVIYRISDGAETVLAA